MKVQQNADLTPLNTFGVAASAALLFEVETEEDLLALPAWQPASDLVLGGGSNILLVDDVPGKVILNRIRGIDLVDSGADGYLVEVGAGENWHALVHYALRQGWHGLENLALIPGLAGAAPVQNIGAYGVELAEVLESVTAWDWLQSRWVVFAASECELGYRDSIFKHEPRDRYFITSIRLRLHKHFIPRLDYTGLREALGKQTASATNVFDAVVNLRRQKLPDPAVVGNAGSFFKNPI
ncbi:MAG TPA: UDP-N-acetylmuramate dehydrogenase, partial [Xanthomonadales bacterium]|nr:UDP-N-acetylmuramate dehydrogenase [Xanthomonadales bacterium]